MEIIRKNSQEILYVYGIYNISNNIYYLVKPNNHPGLLSVKASDANILNNNISDGFIFNLKNDGFTLLLKPLENELFLEKLLECDPEAMHRFTEILGTSSNNK